MKILPIFLFVCLLAIPGYGRRDICPNTLSSFCIGEDFHHAAAHGIHALTLQELQYFFDDSATEDNNIPIINFNLSSPDLTLPSVPDLKLGNSFLTPSMNSVDHILSNWENEDFFMRNASVLEMLVHNLHMYETLSSSGNIYKEIKKSNKSMNMLCNCMKRGENDVLAHLVRASNFFRTAEGDQGWRRKDYQWKPPPRCPCDYNLEYNLEYKRVPIGCKFQCRSLQQNHCQRYIFKTKSHNLNCNTF